MQFSFPWILSRKRLIGAVIADGILFAFLYHSLYEWRFGVWPALSPRLALLLLIWSLSSYIIGRYASGSEKSSGSNAWDLVGKQLVGTSTVLLLTLSITLLHLWLFNKNPVQASFRSFLIPFLGSLAVLSPFVQLTIHRLSVIKGQDRNLTWSYVGSDLGFRQLKNMLKWSRVHVFIKHVSPDGLGEAFCCQYIVDDFHNLPPGVLRVLCRHQLQGSIVLSRLAWCEVVLQRFPSELLSEEDILAGSFSFPRGTWQSRLKRIGDIVVATLLLILVSPVILVSALLINLSDRGPVFYSQIRTGLDGNPFRIWKLRTMRTDAEHHGAQWSSRSDPRITRFGSLLRRTRLDELPQLWCVFNGSMSLIGPRPERPEFDHQLSQKIPYYELRYLIRPGLSGWAQVNYPYGASVEDSANKLSYDLYYLINFSFLLDLLILFKTMRLVFKPRSIARAPTNSNLSL